MIRMPKGKEGTYFKDDAKFPFLVENNTVNL